jgi:hypothetical protein
MSDLFDQVTADQDPFKKIASKIPGFSGYIERQNRRAADKMLRESIADQFEELWNRVGNIQKDLVNQGELLVLDDLETAVTKLRTFIDKVRTASYGYSGFFDAIKVNEEELEKLYNFDSALLDMADEVSAAIDIVETSIGDEGLPAAIRHLIGLTRDLVSTFNNRDEVITATQ